MFLVTLPGILRSLIHSSLRSPDVWVARGLRPDWMEAGVLCLVDPPADVAESAAKGSNSVYNKQKISY
jgi:hypothetical protein